MRHQCGADLAGVRVHRQMDLASGAAPGPAVLTDLPLAFARSSIVIMLSVAAATKRCATSFHSRISMMSEIRAASA
ncbi:hypothetical protein FHX59_002317 [Paraburkholderia silvatlantica]|uniref:Uncharacterized protein n=1 Tax=Paraburkholderia silvatlantica TaxID=321895 RepID=A0ABR6FKK8_9BURK|nr:hypothetical protein [Paraburkholderia silvatlantica]